MDRLTASGKFICLATFLCISASAAAIPITFTAINFEPLGTSGPPPQEVVTGSFDYSLDGSDFFTLNSFDMHILDKIYTLADVSVTQDFGPNTVLMGVDEPGGFAHGTDDFWLEFNFGGGIAAQFAYSVEAPFGDPLVGGWVTHSVLVNGATVPEPGTLLLMSLSLASLFFSKRIKGK